MESFSSTIVAPITAVGGAVAWVRLSGPHAWSIGSKVFCGWPEATEARKAVYGRFVHGDDGFVLPFEADRSYTGEESVEMSVHGSSASVGMLVSACIAAGARMARPGEFTERAFLNGRMDLTQAEAVRDTVEAETGRQLRLANLMREGGLRREVVACRSELLTCAAGVEMLVDYFEDLEEPESVSGSVSDGLQQVRDRLSSLIARSSAGRLIRKGLRIALVGAPNAGKSSLMNALLGHDRAIVAETPGTTRDYLEAHAEIGGIPCVLIDTAGIRESLDPVESEGVRRSGLAVASADLVWHLVEPGGNPDEAVGWELPAGRTWKIASKCDLGCSEIEDMRVSAVTGEGIDALIERVATLGLDGISEGDPMPNERQTALLVHALDAVDQALTAAEQNLAGDVVATMILEADASLTEVVGERASDDLLERIFSQFCVGK